MRNIDVYMESERRVYRAQRRRGHYCGNAKAISILWASVYMLFRCAALHAQALFFFPPLSLSGILPGYLRIYLYIYKLNADGTF